uniref:Uncharacterized protein n=1 Tax=Tanacetum cinerariifolium TaxID=118510 RepID=A0A6L2N3U3_TANCI|nr:hypothetical protein [Tanacetum cinerariifolium]
MDTIIAQQVARDEALVPHAQRLSIGRSNFRLLSEIKSKESTLQLVYDVLSLCPFFKAFLVTADVPEIYMQEFLVTATFHHHAIRFKMDNKKHIVNLESFRDMLHIHLRVEHKNSKKSNEMYYPRFTKGIIHHFMSKVNWHYVRDDHMLSTIKLVSRHQNTQQFGALLPIELTNEEIRNSNAYKEYYAIATGAAPPKPKASVRKTRSSSDTFITPPTAAAGPRLTSSTKGKQAAKASKAKSLSALSEVVLVQMKELVLYQGFSMNPLMSLRKNSTRILLMTKVMMMKEMMVMVFEKDDGEEGDGDNNDEDDDGEEGDDDDDDQEVDLGLNVGREEGHDEEEEEDELHIDVNINQGRGIQATLKVKDSHVTLTPVNRDGMESIFETTSQMDLPTSTSVAPLPMTAPTMTPSTIATITTTNQQMNEAVKVAVQIQSDRLRDKAQRENDEFLKTVDENMQKMIKEQTSYDVAADLSEMELKKILIEKIEGNKSIQRSDEQRNIYKDLIEAYESDKIILDTYGETIMLKRDGKEPESASAPIETTTISAGRSAQGSQSRQASASESAFAEEPMQTPFRWKGPYIQSLKPPSLNRDWNKTVLATHESIQPWISEFMKLSDSCSYFNELMDTPLDFSNFLINRLKVDTLTSELLAGPTYELMKGSCKSLVELEYHLEEVFKATTDQLDWDNPEELKIVEWHNYKHLDWITVRRDDDKLYKLKEGDFKILRIQDIEDMLLLLVKGKLTNLTVKERFAFNVSRSDLKRKEAYTAYSNPRGFIYQNKDRKNRLMQIDELHKFSDGTLIDVRTALDDRLKGIQM